MHVLDIRNSLWSSYYVDLYHLRPVFLALHIAGGIVGLPALVLTCILARQSIPFQLDLINVYVAGIVNSVVYLLLVFAPHWRNPPYSLCFLQAAMVLGAPPMIAVSILLVLIKMHFTFRYPMNFLTRQGSLFERPRAFIFYSLPYLTFIILFFTAIGLQVRSKDSVSSRNNLYCTAYGNPFRRAIVPAVSFLTFAIMIVLEALILQRYVLSYRRIASSFPLAGARAKSRGLIIRVVVFNIYLGVVFGASISFLAGSRSSWPYMSQAALPLAIFLVFGSQQSILRIWFGWLRCGKRPPTNISDTSVMMPPRTHTSETDISLPYSPSTRSDTYTD